MLPARSIRALGVFLLPNVLNMIGGMKYKFLFAVSALALIVWLASTVLFMDMYDVKPHTWGPQGVEFEEWHRVWSACRDLYVWVGICSFLAAIACAVAGWFQASRCPTTH